MSINAHDGPIQTLQQSKSNQSLYTENSQDSELYTYRKQQQQIKNESPRKEEPISQKISKLPNLSPQQSSQKSAPQVIKKSKPIQSFDGMPVLPARGSVNRYADGQPQIIKEIKLGSINGPQFNTIAVGSLPQNDMNNFYGEFQNQMRMSGMSGINQYQKARMMRSSQGGRWLRSQSLMQDNGRQMRPMNHGQLMIRNFHKHQSKYIEQVQHYMKFFGMLKQALQDKKQIFHKYKISLSDSLEEMKNKMEMYLQSKIDLSNLPIDRPDSNWGQEQLMKFYANYHQILIKKLTFPHQDQQSNSRIVTVLKKYKNCTYYGPIKDGKKHGFGYLHYFSGRFYEGLFENDQKVEGFEMDDSELYLGKYQKGQRHGEGILKTNQYLISGIFNNGQFRLDADMNKTALSSADFGRIALKNNENESKILRKGFKIQFSNVTFYIGNEIIVEKNNSNDTYIGYQNEEGEKHGEGLQIFANGDLYIGKYEQSAPQGYGQYYWDSGAFYRGQFLSGMRHGKGTWRMIHGDRYDGQYLNDKKNGRGVYLWKSGDRYQGQFENDYRHGYGEMYWHDGTSFKGQWLNGIQINKTFKLRDQQAGEPRTRQYGGASSMNKSPNKTAQTRTRVLKKEQINKNYSKNDKYVKQVTVSQPSKNFSQANKKKIPLEKLKAILNPTNSKN